MKGFIFVSDNNACYEVNVSNITHLEQLSDSKTTPKQIRIHLTSRVYIDVNETYVKLRELISESMN